MFTLFFLLIRKQSKSNETNEKNYNIILNYRSYMKKKKLIFQFFGNINNVFLKYISEMYNIKNVTQYLTIL